MDITNKIFLNVILVTFVGNKMFHARFFFCYKQYVPKLWKNYMIFY